MGLYYSLVCSNCGYKFLAKDGRGGDDQPAENIKKKLKARQENDEMTRVYWSMDNPHVDYDPVPYHCSKCKEFFNYDRIIISSIYGTYFSECEACPKCSYTLVDRIPYEMLKGKDEYGYGECAQECPKCEQKLIVKSAGIFD